MEEIERQMLLIAEYINKCNNKDLLNFYKGYLSGMATGENHQSSLSNGNQPHNNLQPYLVVNFIIKYAQVSTEALPKEAGIPVGSILEFNGTEEQIPVGYAKYEENSTIYGAVYLETGGDASSGGSNFHFNRIIENIGNCWDATNFCFVAPVSGLYQVNFTWYSNNSSRMCMYVNNRETNASSFIQRGYGSNGGNISTIYKLNAGDKVYAGGFPNYNASIYGASGHNRFDFALIKKI